MRRQLILVFVAVSSLIALAFVLPLAFLVQKTAEDRAIDAGRADAAAIVPVLAVGGSPLSIKSAIGATLSGQLGRITVIAVDGTVIGSGREPSVRLLAASNDGTSSIGPADGGIEVVVALASGVGELAGVSAFVPDEELHRGRDRAWLTLAVVAVLLVAISVTVADRLAHSVVRPTQRLASAATRLGAGDLDTRVINEGPAELVELSTAFNRLGSRIAGMLAHERELVAELSHRLRTPLTRLRMRIEQVDDPALSDELLSDFDEVTRVVNALIEEARGLAEDQPDNANLRDVVVRRAEFWAVLAEDQDRSWSLHVGDEPLPVPVRAADLEAAIDVLLENVFSHTDDGVAMEVGCVQETDFVLLWVGDGGTGFDDEAIERGTSGADSTGLGLDIALRTSVNAGGSMSVATSALGGAQVELRFPLL